MKLLTGNKSATSERDEKTRNPPVHQAKWYHYIELFLLQGPILFPAIALDISGPWEDALPKVAALDLIWVLVGFGAFHYLSKWIALFLIGWILVATVDFVTFGKRLGNK